MGIHYANYKRRKAFEERRRRMRLHLASVVIVLLAITALIVHFI